MSASASAPASSANLGPGYDFLALALELRCEVSLESAAEWSAPAEALDIVQRATAAIGSTGPYAVTVDSEVPVARGLGSSAALAAATAAAVVRLSGDEPDLAAIFTATAAVEGHPDNAAATVYGGLVAVAGTDPRRLSMAPTLVPILAVPNATLPTSEARAAIPATVPHAAAARSAARAAFLIEGLRTGDASALAAAAGDELHEGPRAELSPLTTQLIEVARDGGALHASWSGAGPSMLALATNEDAESIAGALVDALGTEGTVMRPAVAATGVS